MFKKIGIFLMSIGMRSLQGRVAFGFSTTCYSRTSHHSTSALFASSEAEKLLEKAAQIRKELAELEGKSLVQVQKEAQAEKDLRSKQQLELQLKKDNDNLKKNSQTSNGSRRSMNNPMVYVPETIDDQIRQASLAIERAFTDGITRQTVRLALVKQNEMITPEEEEWPGGAMQMYREAGRPLTEALLNEVRAVAKNIQTDEEKKSGKENYPPNVKAQDIWDFDVSVPHES